MRIRFLATMIAIAAATMAYPADSPPPLQSTFAFTATVSVGPIMVIDNGPIGQRRFVPITGGTVSGPLLTAKVLEGSGDWQVLRSDGVISVDAKYILETSDGVRLAVFNRGIRVASAAVTARMMRGESVPPSEYYFRTTAEIEAPLGSRYKWLNRTLFIGIAERKSDAAIVHFYQLK